MNTNALRQKILDLAIHGKLVKQDPSDESATILLERIRAEKEKKIASGELKHGKNDSYIFFGDDNRHYEKFSDGRVKDIEDEIPFAVPEGWAWCRLGEIGQIISGTSYQKNDIISKGTLRILRGGNIQNNALILKNDDIFIQNKYIDIRKNVILGDIIIVASTGSTNSIGKPAFIDKDYTYTQIGAFLRIIRMILLPISKYINLIFQSEYYTNYIQNNIKGTNINNIKAEHLQRMVLPLPPLSEQQRIVAKIETIFAHIDLLEQNKADLQTAAKQAKSKILDLAIRGKLVPQDPADEPASVMLEKLRAEKEAKIASGEIKCGKNDSYIYKNSTDNCYYQKYTDGCEENISDEIPFTVPEGWLWCRLGEIYYHTTGKALKKSNEKGSLKKYITTSNLYWDTFDLSEVRTMYFTDDELDKYTIKKGDLVLCNGGDVGRAAIWSYDKDICYQNHISRMRPKTNGIENRFFLYVLMFYKEQNMLNGKGIGISSLSASDLLSIIIPLPPLAEQKRIVAKIEELFAKLDFITTAL